MNNLLRNLSPDTQVLILFAVVFGVLIAATAGLIVRQMYVPDDADHARQRQDLTHYQKLLGISWAMMSLFWISWVLGDTVAIVLFALVSFFALREFISLSPTRHSDHRSLVLVFFVVLPLQYVLVGLHMIGLFTVLIPVYVFLAVPAVSAVGNEPGNFLERNAKLQWGIMVCVYGMSYVPALLLLEYPDFKGRSAFLVFFLVMVVQICMLVQHLVARRFPSQPIAPEICNTSGWKNWGAGLLCGTAAGGVLAVFTPLNFWQGLGMAFIACVAGTLGHFVMKAIKRDRGITSWGHAGRSVTGASGLLDKVDALCFAAPVFFHTLVSIFPAGR